jgi:hypothetical protein
MSPYARVRQWHIPAASQRARRGGINQPDLSRANGSFPWSLATKPSFRLRPALDVAIDPVHACFGSRRRRREPGLRPLSRGEAILADHPRSNRKRIFRRGATAVEYGRQSLSHAGVRCSVRSNLFQYPIHLHPRAPERLRDGSSPMPSSIHCAHGLAADPPFASAIDAIRSCSLDTFPLPVLDEPALHLSHHAEHGHVPRREIPRRIAK